MSLSRLDKSLRAMTLSEYLTVYNKTVGILSGVERGHLLDVTGKSGDLNSDEVVKACLLKLCGFDLMGIISLEEGEE